MIRRLMGRWALLGVATLLLVAGIATGAALAQSDPPAGSISEAEAVAAATSAVPGDVVETEFEEENGVLAWGIEIRTGDGTVIEVNVDPETGAILGTEIDDDKPGEKDDD